jgi:hypothetical protein
MGTILEQNASLRSHSSLDVPFLLQTLEISTKIFSCDDALSSIGESERGRNWALARPELLLLRGRSPFGHARNMAQTIVRHRRRRRRRRRRGEHDPAQRTRLTVHCR